MKVYIGADHNGFDLKATLMHVLSDKGISVVDKGNVEHRPDDDFPEYAEQVAQAMQESDDPDVRGILICGSGQGMCMAANRFKGIRASLVWDISSVRASRNDDDSNVLCLPARYMEEAEAVRLTEEWLATPFDGAPRFKRRIQELDDLGHKGMKE